MKIVNYFIDQMMPTNIRMGLGVGVLTTKLQKQAIGMDGPAFYRAKEAIDEAHKDNGVIIKFDNKISVELATDINIILSLLVQMRKDWTANQRQIINLVDDGLSQQDIANRLSITQPAVSQSLNKARWSIYLNAHNYLENKLDKVFKDLRENEYSDMSGLSELACVQSVPD